MLVLNKKTKRAIIIGSGFNFAPIANFISKHGDTIKQAIDIGSAAASLATSTVGTIKNIRELVQKKREPLPQNIQDVLNRKSVQIIEGAGFKII
jgi:hypothetical protein